MAPKSSRLRINGMFARRQRPTKFGRLRFEQLEDRTTPALFNVQTALSFSGLNNNGCVAAVDLNKDGLEDAILTNFGTDYASGAATTITVLYGKVGGGFNKVALNTSGSNVSFVSVADINGDTWPDAVVVNANKQNTGSVSVFKNDGAGNLSLFATPFSTFGNNSSWVGLADVTGDGVLDAVVASFGKDDGAGSITGNNATIFQGNADGQGHGDFTFTGPITTLAPEIQFIPTALAVADFDGDGILDIAAAVPGVPPTDQDPQPNGNIYMFKGSGSGGFDAPNQFDSGGALPANIQAADINGDTKPDLIVANVGDPNASPEFSNNSVGVILNVSSVGNLSFGITNSLTSNCHGTFAVGVADFNLDGKADIAAVNYGSEFTSTPAAFVSVYMGNGAGTMTPGSPGTYTTTPNIGGGQYLAVGDYDSNGSPDLIVAHASNKVGLMFNTSVAAPTVTINQGSGQADPTNSTSIVFDVVFSEGMTGFDVGSDVDLSGSSGGGGGLSAAINQIDSSHYTVTVTGMIGTGTVKATIPAGKATSSSGGVANLASTSTDNQVNFDLISPTVTINQAAGQSDPTTTGPISFTVVFSENVTGFGNNDIDLSASSLSGLSATVSQNTPSNYTVSVTGMSGNGTVVAKVVAGAAIDGVGNASAASTSTDNTVTFGTPTAPSVTINQGASQADPTNSTSIVFDVVFSEGVTGFTSADVDLSGSSVGGLSASVTPISTSAYTVAVTGMAGAGTVQATIPAGAATSISGSLASLASTSTDNQVTFDFGVPTVTINQAAGQADPTTTGPILFTVVFSENVTGFGNNDVDLSGSSLGGLSASVSQNTPSNYTVSVTGMSGSGTVVANVVAGAATDGAGNANAASTSTDNTVTFDVTAPTVTINQAVGQSDPTNVAPIKFDVKFSEPVTGFDLADVSLAGSTVGGSLSVTVSGSLDTYSVTVTGMTTRGFVVATIPAGAAHDGVGNASTASTSTDNSVEFLNNGTLGFSQAVYNTAEDATAHSISITVTRAGQTDGAVSIQYGTSSGTAHSGGPANAGQNDYTPTTGTLSWADGEGGDKTFSITINPDTLNEGKELINLALTNDTGFPGLGLTSATVAIAPSDGQGPGLYADQDGDLVRIKLNGKTGSMQWFRTDPDGDSLGPIELIELKDTLPDPLKPKAALVITVTKSKINPGDGMVGLGAITGDGLKSITARKANLNLEGINFNGYLGSLIIGNISNGADITTLATLNPLQKTRINALEIGNGTTIDVGCEIANLTATRIGAGSIIAPSIRTMLVKGQAKPTVFGDMASDITLSGAGLAAGKSALGSLTVAGSIPNGADIVAPSVGTIVVRNNMAGDITISGAGVGPTKKALTALRVKGAVTGSDIFVTGNVGAVVVGAFRDSRLFAGYVGPDDGTGTFNFPATVSTFRSTGKIDGFQNSYVIATKFKTVAITNLDSTNSSNKFGFYADTSLGSITVTGPTKFKYNAELQAPQGVGDFEVRVV